MSIASVSHAAQPVSAPVRAPAPPPPAPHPVASEGGGSRTSAGRLNVKA